MNKIPLGEIQKSSQTTSENKKFFREPELGETQKSSQPVLKFQKFSNFSKIKIKKCVNSIALQKYSIVYQIYKNFAPAPS